MSDFLIAVLCFLYVTAEVFAGFLLSHCAHWKSEYVRKFIHILTSFIIIPAEYCIENPVYRIAVPVLFIFINAFAVATDMIKGLGMKDKRRNLGLVLYPVSVSGVVLLEILGIITPESAVTGVLVMGLGDGLAAVVGTKWGRHGYTVYGKYHKSIEGSLAMAAVTAACALCFTKMSLPYALLLALIMSLVENLSPSTVDNVSVPFAAALLSELFSTL